MTIKTINLKRCLWWLSWGLIIIGSVLCFVVPYVDNLRIEKITKELTDRYGLVVRYGDPPEFHIPPLPAATNDDTLNIDRADHHQVVTALEGIRSALSKYPPDLIRKYLSAVFVTGIIKSHGLQASGIYNNSWIYLSVSSGPNPQTYAEIFHHELSSLFIYGPYSKPSGRVSNTIIFKAPSCPFAKWRFVNEPSFKYLERDIDFVHAIRNLRKYDGTSLCYKRGFVSEYGKTSLENDVNTYAELAMEHPAKLKELAGQYPRIAQKTRLFVEFYTSLAPEMGNYFKSVGL